VFAGTKHSRLLSNRVQHAIKKVLQDRTKNSDAWKTFFFEKLFFLFVMIHLICIHIGATVSKGLLRKRRRKDGQFLWILFFFKKQLQNNNFVGIAIHPFKKPACNENMKALNNVMLAPRHSAEWHSAEKQSAGQYMNETKKNDTQPNDTNQ
jgi:hypothetical protein